MSLAQAVSGTGRDDPGVAYLESLQETLNRAAAVAGGIVERDLEIAGVRLRLRCAGDAISDALLPPFEHLEVRRNGASDLTIGLFDTASTGVEPPPLPWRLPPVTPGTNPMARFESARICALAAAGTGALTVADPIAGTALYYLPDAGRIPASERAAPLREALHMLMTPRQRWMIHAGAVGRRGRGALLVGRGGSGKSTLALSCALAGMEFVSDDYLLLEVGRSPIAHAMQSTARLTEDSVARLGLSPETIDPAGFESTIKGPAKALFDLGTIAPQLLRRRLEIGAIVNPIVSDLAIPRLEPITSARCLRALAPSTVLQLRSHSSPMLAALGELVRQVPCYALRLSSDSSANAATVAELVDDFD